MSDLPELRFLDEAARAAGWENYRDVSVSVPSHKSVVAHAKSLQKLVELEAGIRKVRDGYASQMKFCDIEALGYFREFLRRVDAVLPSPPKGDVA